MTKLLKKTLVCIIILSLVLCAGGTSSLAANKLDKPSISSIKQTKKSSVKVSWSKVSGAKGYELQYKISDGDWITKSTKKKSITVSELSTDTTYFFRVRAYKKNGNKIIYSNYSVLKKYTVRDYIYLVDLYEPYDSECYEAYQNGKYFMMGGKKQRNGFTLKYSSSYANFNIEGKYSKIVFDFGMADNTNCKSDYVMNVLSDGTLIQDISGKAGELPQNIEIPLEYTERLTFERGNRADTLVGFAEVKLYFQ
jgi:hypothetical protein